MNNKFLIKTCELFYASHYFPIACFDNNENVLKSFAAFENFDKVFSCNLKKASSANPDIIYGVTGLYGLITVTGSNQKVIIGPYLNKPLSDQTLDSIICDAGIEPIERNPLSQYLSSIPKLTYNQFLNLICFLHFIINKEDINAIEHFNIADTKYMDEIGTKHTEELLKEEDQIHGTYLFEQQLLSFVRNGDVEGITAFFKQVADGMTFSEGKLADNALRQQKNLTIGLICMIGKSGAIKGNLDIEQTYNLIDLYTLECERCQSIDEIATLRYNAVLDFTRRVAELKHPESVSHEVYTALQFIKTHTNHPIGVMDVVNHIGKSRSVFLKQFKDETGDTIARCIMTAKLQEAKLLLAYSSRSLADISNFLYFSSQSHFNNTFKKEYGITPLKYRKKKQK